VEMICNKAEKCNAGCKLKQPHKKDAYCEPNLCGNELSKFYCKPIHCIPYQVKFNNENIVQCCECANLGGLVQVRPQTQNENCITSFTCSYKKSLIDPLVLRTCRAFKFIV